MCFDKINIFLTGFMGAGKSTTGTRLASKLGCSFVDLDDLIVSKEGRSIADIFASDGEAYFRDCESALLDTLDNQQAAVYATGGGVVIRAENRRRMRKIGKIVYLQAGWDSLRNRLEKSTDRPLIKAERDWQEVHKLWKGRQEYYRDADLMIDTDGLTPEEVAQQIVTLLKVEVSS